MKSLGSIDLEVNGKEETYCLCGNRIYTEEEKTAECCGECK